MQHPHNIPLTYEEIELMEMQWAFEEQVPLTPLAMGNYETRVTVRKARAA